MPVIGKGSPLLQIHDDLHDSTTRVTTVSRRRLWWCLGISVIVHVAIILYLLNYTQKKKPTTSSQTSTINIKLNTPHSTDAETALEKSMPAEQEQPPTNTSTQTETRTAISNDSTSEPNARIISSSQSQPSTKPAEPIELTEPIESAEPGEIIPAEQDKPQTQIFNLQEQLQRAVQLERTTSSDSLTFEQLGTCTEQDLKSDIINCDLTSEEQYNPALDRLPIKASRLIVKNFELGNVDFKQRTQLIKQLINLESLSSDESIDKKTLLNHRRRLTQEINNIDDQQTRFGLLKIPIIASQIIINELKEEGHYDSSAGKPQVNIEQTPYNSVVKIENIENTAELESELELEQETEQREIEIINLSPNDE